MKLVGIVQVYNEVERGNLQRCLQCMVRYCDDIVIYDDGSTDNSVEVAHQFTDHVLCGEVNDFANETRHRNAMLQCAVGLGATHVFWLDADEVLEWDSRQAIWDLCERGGSWSFEEVTLWRSTHWRRMDYLGSGWFTRLWQVFDGIRIREQRGLHRQLYPEGLEAERAAPRVLHFGYVTQEAIERRWRERTQHGVPVDIRRRGLDESCMILEPVPEEWFPPSVEIDINEEKPTPIRYAEDIMAEAGL